MYSMDDLLELVCTEKAQALELHVGAVAGGTGAAET
jgi:hypothetical protein